jgi:hypothetical protein
MLVNKLARVIACMTPSSAAATAGLVSLFAALPSVRETRAWRGNLRAVGLGPERGFFAPLAPLYHHLLLQYESLALLGGRCFDVRVDGENHLHRALALNRGLLVATAHVGSWHVGARILHERSGLPVHSVAGTQMLRAWTAGLRLAYRRLGLRIHPRRHAGRRLLRALRSREIVALHLDGDQHGGVGPATRGIHLLARRTGCPLLPAVAERSGPGALTLRFFPFLEGGANTPQPDGLASLLVDLVREHPEQWALFRPLWEKV